MQIERASSPAPRRQRRREEIHFQWSDLTLDRKPQPPSPTKKKPSTNRTP
ncbi:hypothetical protein Bca52824_089164 [Brassica carinata]|uniref:Uncharacterized protein n=1 Tax=Brassica carinata TaxID=52824 RepID=A0A8X7PCR2_BRACI|nr:hypothetical protein Bca52824_089164 [Brassica carinata]